jgi:hypothetical protein
VVIAPRLKYPCEDSALTCRDSEISAANDVRPEEFC